MATEFIDKTIFFLTEIYSNLIIKLVAALIILFIGFIVGKILGRLVFKLLNEININRFFKSSTGINAKPDIIISKTVTYLIDFFVIIIAFDAIALTPRLIYIMSGAILVIIVFSILIGIKDVIPNAVAGLSIYRKRDIREGDKITVREHQGQITKISLTETVLKKKNGDFLYIPNSEMLRNYIIKKK